MPEETFEGQEFKLEKTKYALVVKEKSSYLPNLEKLSKWPK